MPNSRSALAAVESSAGLARCIRISSTSEKCSQITMRAMKLSVEFPSVSYREGPDGVAKIARAVEQIGYDHIDVFDHVVMGFPVDGRPPGLYPATMPILEAFMTLAYIAAVTSRVTLGTEVLVLPQR